MNIESSTWPLVVITFSPVVDLAELEVLFRYFEKDNMPRKAQFALIVDTRPVSALPDAVWRARLTGWMNDPAVRMHSQRYNVASATILSSSIVRAAYTALSWIWKAPSPQLAAADMQEAASWCRDRLQRAQVPLSPRFRDFCRTHDAA